MKTSLFFAFAAFCCAFLAYGDIAYEGLVAGAHGRKCDGDVQRIFYVHVPAATVAFTLSSSIFSHPSFTCGSAARRRMRWPPPRLKSAWCSAPCADYRANLGALCLGCLVVALGHASQYHTYALAAVRQLSDDAPLFDGRIDLGLGSSAGGLFFSRRADCLHGQPLVPHAPSCAHDRHAEPGSTECNTSCSSTCWPSSALAA